MFRYNQKLLTQNAGYCYKFYPNIYLIWKCSNNILKGISTVFINHPSSTVKFLDRFRIAKYTYSDILSPYLQRKDKEGSILITVVLPVVSPCI